MPNTNTLSENALTIEAAKCYAKMGQICTMINKPNEAITYYTNAIMGFEKHKKLTKILIKCYKNRHKAYLQIGETKKANIDLKLIAHSKSEKRHKFKNY